MGQTLSGKIVRRSPSSCPGPNNLPPLQFHTVHGDNIRISRDGTLARRFESFCRAITFSARPVRINEKICVKIAETANNWQGGIRFGFTTSDPCTLENGLPKYACPDLTRRPGFWVKALNEQYCERDNILYFYVNPAGDVIYGINNEEKGVILSGIDTRGLLWTLIDIYGNCTAIEFLDARIYMYQQGAGGGVGGGGGGVVSNVNGSGVSVSSITGNLTNFNTTNSHNGLSNTMLSPQLALNSNHPHQQSRRSLPALTSADQELERHLMPSIQSLNIAGGDHMTAVLNSADLANGLPPLRYNAAGRLLPIPFHFTKGRNVRLSHDRFIALRAESDFCQGYVFTARPIRIGEKIIVQVLKTDSTYVGALALGLTSCNPALLQPNDLPNDSDFLLDRPEYWVVSKDIASTPQKGDEIAFFVAPNGEVTISKNNGPAIVVMHVDQSLQLWAFLDVYGSTQSVRMFRQQLPNMAAGYPPIAAAQAQAQAQATSSNNRLANLNNSESINSLNSQLTEARKLLHSGQQLNITQSQATSNISNSCSTLSSMQSCNNSNMLRNQSANGGTTTTTTTISAAPQGHMISVPNTGDMIQIQPNVGGTVLVVNLPPASSQTTLNEISSTLSVSQARINQNGNGQITTSGIIAGACTSIGGNTTIMTPQRSQCSETHLGSQNNITNSSVQSNNKWKDTVDHAAASFGCGSSNNAAAAAAANNDSNAECTICYENQIDSVLYMCGHMCMCYDCAIKQWRGVGGGHCPLCRAVIRDVIRTYTT